MSPDRVGITRCAVGAEYEWKQGDFGGRQILEAVFTVIVIRSTAERRKSRKSDSLLIAEMCV